MKYHSCVDVSGALKMKRSNLSVMFRRADGSRLTADEAHGILCDHLSQGHEVIPIGKACEGFDYKTGCPGHTEFEGASA